MSQKPMVNGDKPQSLTVNHIFSYPLVSDCSHIYQTNPLGAKSISLFQQLYATFAVPVLPYLQTPYSILSPYLQNADQLADHSLSRVDDTFPAVKSTNLESLKSSAFNVAHFPFKIAGESKDYVVDTYSDEYKKCGEPGITTTGKAVLSTELRIVSEVMHSVADYLGPKRDEAVQKAEQLKKMGQEKAANAQKLMNGKIEESKKTAAEKKEQLANSN